MCYHLPCETGFSELATIKAKARNRLDVRSDIRLAVSKTKPMPIKKTLKQKQAQFRLDEQLS